MPMSVKFELVKNCKNLYKSYQLSRAPEQKVAFEQLVNFSYFRSVLLSHRVVPREMTQGLSTNHNHHPCKFELMRHPTEKYVKKKICNILQIFNIKNLFASLILLRFSSKL